MNVTRISRIEVFVYRVPIARPVATSFGVMTNRPAVFVRLTDQDGIDGWGEIFANWPAAGAEHRARLLMEDISDLVIGYEAEKPSDLYHFLTSATHIRALQCGEFGPFGQVIAGLDTAIHDLFARRAGVPLARFLNPQAQSEVPSYASGIQISAAGELVPRSRDIGHRAFKVKVGFDAAKDLVQLRALVDSLQPDERLFVDANQAWNVNAAVAFATATKDFGLGWIEEPIRADEPETNWAAVASASATPIAAGENITGFEDFERAIKSGHIQFVQPDVAKWGGITGCYAVGRQAIAEGRTYCPHFLGGGIGLIASAHLLAAAGGNGLLEVDINPNPLRDLFFANGEVPGGDVNISDAPGLGIEAIPSGLEEYKTLSLSRH